MDRSVVNVGSIFLVPSVDWPQNLQEKQKLYPHLPTLAQIGVDINILNNDGGVPALVHNRDKGKPLLFVYTPSYYLELSASTRDDSYSIERISPLNLEEHEQLAQGALLLHATLWHICMQAKDIPHSQSNHQSVIETAWCQLKQQEHKTIPQEVPSAVTPVPAYEDYLNAVNALIDVLCRLEHDKSKLASATSYVGNVSSQARRKAIEMLREGKSTNRHLLQVLVDHTYQPYQCSTVELLDRALTVPDILLVQGAPGTGRTHTIVEFIRQCAAHKQRVLVTAKTQTAIARLLERLPDELNTIYLGPQEHSASAAHSQQMSVQVRDVQERLLQKTEDQAQQFARLVTFASAIDRWIDELKRIIAQFTEDGTEVVEILQRRDTIEQLINAPFQPRLNELRVALQQQEELLTRHKAKLSLYEQRHTAVKAGKRLFALDALISKLILFCTNHSGRLRRTINSLQAAYATLQQEYKQFDEIRQQMLREDPEYCSCEERVRQLTANSEGMYEEALKAAMILSQTVELLVPTQPPLEPLSIETLQQYLDWYTATRPLLEKKHALLSAWRAELSSHIEQLTPVLLDGAAVVAGTYADVAASRELEDRQFDLAIVAEAEQLSLPDLLIPLVSASRCILLGDRYQPPPCTSREVQTWLASLSPQTQQRLHLHNEEEVKRVTSVLTMSAFEALLTHQVDPDHVIYLTEQRSMPQVIADFVSEHVYEMPLSSEGEEAHQQDLLFKAPLVLIDTASLPFKQRRESTPTKRKRKKATDNPEGWGKAGYLNVAEARLLIDLAAACQSEGKEWQLLVPYQAQATLISRLVHQRIERKDFPASYSAMEQHIATVDALQGNLYDVVLYGFTRSNANGDIGMLQELRLLNAVMTHSRRQLILVGDMSTLKQARDNEFRQRSQALYDHVKQHGALLTYQECLDRLNTLSAKKSGNNCID
jgi:hypothetical protein